MALYLQNNEIDIERTGVSANVPNNDVARLMYYLQCACTAIDCNNDPDIQRYTSYNNWARLSIDEQRALLVVCLAFSPDVLDDKVFFHSDELCGDSSNEFYKIHQVRHQLLAVESIIVAGRTRQVNQIMTYTMRWMRTYFDEPMPRLVARLKTASQPRPITYTPSYSAPIIRQPTPKKRGSKGWGICGSVCCVVIIIIIISIIVSNQKK